MELHQDAKKGRNTPLNKNELWESIAQASKAAKVTKEVNEILETPAPIVAIEAETPSPVLIPKKSVLAESIAAFSTVTPPANGLVGDSLLPAVVVQSDESASTGLVTKIARFPHNVPEKLKLFLGQDGKAYAEMDGNGNSYAVLIGSKQANNAIRLIALNDGSTVRKSDITETNHFLQAHAETARIIKSVWNRIAPVSGGIAIDIGNEQHTHIQITAGKVEIVSKGSMSLFYRTATSQPMVMPADTGNLNLLKKYLNLNTVSIILLIAWISYTLAHPKVPTSKYLHLVLMGNYGAGKSFICWIIQQLIDPGLVGVQVLPSNATNLSIAAQNAHVIFYDNIREISPAMSDSLCIAATGGAMSSRELYTNADQNVIKLHAALVLNGIHPFIEQPDLAQRCLQLELLPITENKRKSEVQLAREFQQDLPMILRGLFNLIAKIFTHLPTVEVTNPERMIDFVNWLAAMEKVNGDRAGDYQSLYSDVINQGQLDSILDNVLASTVLEFAHEHINGEWSGTPAALLVLLNKLAARESQRSKEWPLNTIALSKRLVGLQASLRTQGVTVELSRGKERTVTITSAVIAAPTKVITQTSANKSTGVNYDDDDLY